MKKRKEENKVAKEEEEEPKEEKKKKAMRSVYIGESFRCARLRLFEHFRDYKASKPTSHMFTHYEEFHKDEEKPTFRAKVLRYHSNSTQRQLHEATLLWRLSKQNGVSLHLMNQKGMYNRSHLERLGLQESYKESHVRDPGKRQTRMKTKCWLRTGHQAALLDSVIQILNIPMLPWLTKVLRRRRVDNKLNYLNTSQQTNKW